MRGSRPRRKRSRLKTFGRAASIVWTVPLGLTLGLIALSLVRLPKVLPNNSIDTATRNAAFGVVVIAIIALWAIYLGLALRAGRIL